ncbi:TetR/AcrR family transcriptional regulator [Salinivibrio costicola]|uniref:TetR/AcrR family transcriptional regulator n=1 Tax=Salinivibrio costicola TaxID=51367 RepID=A0ABX6KAN5_SALCS|nr:TetR/AcrR family transcriptional regulator [Salinivibrio costicola]QIR07658.1 TetR/AcrR family transcriptional regulator [Salinivibrio costicola]
MLVTELEKKILNVAKVLIERDGVFSFKLSDLARLSGISRPTLYSQFRGKEDIFICLYIRHLEFARENLVTIINTDYLNNKERLIAYYVGSSYFMSVEFSRTGLVAIATNKSVEEAAANQSVTAMKERQEDLHSLIGQLWDRVQPETDSDIAFITSLRTAADMIKHGVSFTRGTELRVIFSTFKALFSPIRWKDGMACDEEKVEDYIRNLYAWD